MAARPRSPRRVGEMPDLGALVEKLQNMYAYLDQGRNSESVKERFGPDNKEKLSRRIWERAYDLEALAILVEVTLKKQDLARFWTAFDTLLDSRDDVLDIESPKYKRKMRSWGVYKESYGVQVYHCHAMHGGLFVRAQRG